MTTFAARDHAARDVVQPLHEHWHMKPQMFVIAMSCRGCAKHTPRARDSARQSLDAKVYPVLAVRCAVCHREPATPVGTIEFIAAERDLSRDVVAHADLRADACANGSGGLPLAALEPPQMFDVSPQELSAILEWHARELEALLPMAN